MWFTVDELVAMDLPWTAEYIESRGRGKSGENVDLLFRHDWVLYHVLMFVDPGGNQSYPEAFALEDGTFVVDCPEVELYATRRPVLQFRKVNNDASV